MKSRNIIHFVALAVLSQLVHARGQGTAFIYQGQLNDNGSPANGIYDLRFAIYTVPSAGSPLAGLVTNSARAVSNGLFTATLDFGTGVFTGPARWLDIAVRTNGGASFTNLVPRQALLAMPYSIFAGTASNVASGSVVKSLNSLKDNVTLAAGANVTLTPAGNTLTISSAGAGAAAFGRSMDQHLLQWWRRWHRDGQPGYAAHDWFFFRPRHYGHLQQQLQRGRAKSG
jgi:hypothetical protein